MTKTTPQNLCPCCGKPMRKPDGAKPWTPEEDALLTQLVSTQIRHKDIAERLSRPVSSISSRKLKLGLMKYQQNERKHFRNWGPA